MFGPHTSCKTKFIRLVVFGNYFPLFTVCVSSTFSNAYWHNYWEWLNREALMEKSTLKNIKYVYTGKIVMYLATLVLIYWMALHFCRFHEERSVECRDDVTRGHCIYSSGYNGEIKISVISANHWSTIRFWCLAPKKIKNKKRALASFLTIYSNV